MHTFIRPDRHRRPRGGCGASSWLGAHDDADSGAYLTLRIVGSGPNLAGSELNMTAWDSVILRAEVMGTPEAYHPPIISTSDSTTTEPISPWAVIRVSDGAWRDSTASPLGTGLWGTAWGRAGTYTASVEVAGYRPWSRAGIVVDGGLCHVIPVSITAHLQRQ